MGNGIPFLVGLQIQFRDSLSLLPPQEELVFDYIDPTRIWYNPVASQFYISVQYPYGTCHNSAHIHIEYNKNKAYHSYQKT